MTTSISIIVLPDHPQLSEYFIDTLYYPGNLNMKKFLVNNCWTGPYARRDYTVYSL